MDNTNTEYQAGYKKGYSDGPSWEEGTWSRSISKLTGNESEEFTRGYKDGWRKRFEEDE